MIATNSHRIEGSSAELACSLRCTEKELLDALPSLQSSGLGDVIRHSNGRVTLICRRLLAEYKHREAGCLRVQRFREKRTCNAHSPPMVSGTLASGSAVRVEGSGEGEVELPQGFPQTVDDAINRAGFSGADPVFIATLWNGAMARNGMDGAGQPIRRWANYVAKHWPKEQAKRAEAKMVGKSMAKTIDETVGDAELRKVRANLKKLDEMENESRY